MLSGLSNYAPEDILSCFDNLKFFLRMLLSGFLGAMIGLERASRNKEAGIRTHIIIAVTASTLMILSKYAFVDLADVPGTRGADSARIAAQVVSGISFLCAGVIFRSGKYDIRGLTTAAGMWATAATGLCVGAGLYWVGITETAILVVMQIILHKHPVGNDALSTQEIRIRIAPEGSLDDVLARLRTLHKSQIIQCEISRDAAGTRARLTLRSPEKITPDEAVSLISEDANLREISV